jgi:3-hydroxybutyrate dehydrogenase
MDGEFTNVSLTLALQLTTLASIATGLVLYLVCSGRNGRAGHRKICGPYYYEGDPAGASECGSGRAVLVTACDGALGLQIAKHLHALGFRVFAGFKDPSNSIAAKLLVAATTPTPPSDEEASVPVPIHPAVCPIALDVTREDMLHEAVDLVRQRLPASQQGEFI